MRLLNHAKTLESMLDVFETISTSNTGVADTFMDSEVLNGNIKKKKKRNRENYVQSCFTWQIVSAAEVGNKN